MKLLLLATLLLASLSYAQDPNSYSSFFNNTSNVITDNTNQFIDAAGAAGQTVPTVFGTVFDSFGTGSCGDSWSSSQSGVGLVIGLWIAPAVFTAFIIVIGVAIIYMLGQMMSSPSMIALAKEELFQTGLTLVRVVFLIGTLSAAQMWYGISASGTSDRIYNNPANRNMIDAAMGFSRLMVSDMTTHYSMLLMYNMVIHTIYSSTMWFGVTWRAMYSFNLGPVLRPLIDILGSALQFLSLGISEWLLHIVTLCLIKKWTWGLFIPMGMLLRAFPYTRSAGESLIALTFALAVFYPFMFLLDYEVHKIMKYSIVDPQKAVGGFLHNSGILGVVGTVLIAMFLMAGVFIPFFLGGALGLAFELIKGSVYYIVIMGIFLPFLNIFVTLTAAKETANFFKVDVNFMSFLKII
jgi:hypothetical protein